MNDKDVMFIGFRVSGQLKELVVKNANIKKMRMSEYVREAVLFEMIMSGDIEAFKFVVSASGSDLFKVTRGIVQGLRKQKE